MRLNLNWFKLYRIVSYKDKYLAQYRKNFWNYWSNYRAITLEDEYTTHEYCGYNTIEEAREALRVKVLTDEIDRLKVIKAKYVEYI
jgi:hypothetical protein